MEKKPSSAFDIPLLDSSLITRTILKRFSIKIIDCGDFIGTYTYEEDKTIRPLPAFKERTEDYDYDYEESEDIKLKEILPKNVLRSKLACQRLAKANYEAWSTFITLTYADNFDNVKEANKNLASFLRQVKRHKTDLKYLAIPEFQKRGAIHYHLLTNIEIDDKKLITSQKNNNYFKHIKYWNYGFTKVDKIKGDIKKIIGYISKYMTKDIDNRLFSQRRFLYSQNLKRPITRYIDLDNPKDLALYLNLLKSKKLNYESTYIDKYTGNSIYYQEYVKS